ncbi:MAG: Lrp/AsnC family transcriptional regulator, partial [Pseudomonadota bacterium]
ARLYALPEVISTKSYVALSTYLERPVQAGVSDL